MEELYRQLWESQRTAAQLTADLERLRSQHRLLAHRASLCADRLQSVSQLLDAVTTELQAARNESAALLLWATGGLSGKQRVRKAASA